MKVLIIYHAARMSDASATFRGLAATAGINLTLATAKRIAVNQAYDPSGFLITAGKEDIDGYTRMPIPLVDSSDPTCGWDQSALSDTINFVKPDVIHVLDEAFSVALAQVSSVLANQRIPLFFYAFENMPLSSGIRSRIRYWRCWRNVTGGAAANTEAFKRLWAVGFPRSKPLSHVPWGIDTAIYKRPDEGAPRPDWATPDVHVVGFVGRLAPEKGVLVILDALRELPGTVHGMFVGAGPLADDLARLAAQGDLAGRLHLYPATGAADMPKLYAAMDCLAVPSMQTEHWKEQFGRVIPEAMACGTPVIGSSSGAIPEVIGDAGIVVTEGDSHALAVAITSIIDNPDKTRRMVELGLARARDSYSGEAMAANLIKLYSRVCLL